MTLQKLACKRDTMHPSQLPIAPRQKYLKEGLHGYQTQHSIDVKVLRDEEGHSVSLSVINYPKAKVIDEIVSMVT